MERRFRKMLEEIDATTLDAELPKRQKKDDVSVLAVQTKDDPSFMTPLWGAVHRLIAHWARKYASRSQGRETHMWDADDLIQAGYFALVEAVKKYDPESGYAFTTFLNFYIRRQFTATSGRGLNGKKQTPEVNGAGNAVSLDAPLNDGTDVTFVDQLACPHAEFAANIIDHMAVRQACADLLAEINTLPEEQRQALLLTSWRGMSWQHACMELGITFKQLNSRKARAVKTVRNSETGRRIKAELDLGDPHRETRSYNYGTSFTEAIELAAILSKGGLSNAPTPSDEKPKSSIYKTDADIFPAAGDRVEQSPACI